MMNSKKNLAKGLFWAGGHRIACGRKTVLDYIDKNFFSELAT